MITLLLLLLMVLLANVLFLVSTVNGFHCAEVVEAEILAIYRISG